MGNLKIENALEKVLQIQENSLTTNELIKAKIVQHDNKINSLSLQFGNIEDDMEMMRGDIADLKLNEEITHEQNREIKQFAHARVNKMLNYPAEAKYFQTFIMNLYGYLRRNSQLGNPIAITRKKHYDTIMKGIEAWHPNIQELKDRKDKRDEVQ